MIYLDEKPRFTFANFLHLFIQGPPLTHSALYHIITQISVTIIHSIDLPQVQTSMSRHTDSAVYVGWDPTPTPGITDDKVN